MTNSVSLVVNGLCVRKVHDFHEFLEVHEVYEPLEGWPSSV